MVNEMDMQATKNIRNGMKALIIKGYVYMADWTCLIKLEMWADGFERYTFVDLDNPTDSIEVLSWEAARQVEDEYLQ